MADYEDEDGYPYGDEYEMLNDLEYSDDNEMVYDVRTIYENCIIPSLTDGLIGLVLPLIVANSVLRIFVALTTSRSARRVAEIAAGVSLVFYHFREDTNLALTLIVMATIGSTLAMSSKRFCIWIYCAAIIAINELLISCEYTQFARLRSQVMLLFMKLISSDEIFNLSKKSEEVLKPNTFMELSAYIFHPSSVILGAWHHPFRSYRNLPSIKCLFSLIQFAIFLTFATCLLDVGASVLMNDYLIPVASTYLPVACVSLIIHLSTAYFVALQFRLSHYAMCFLNQSALEFWNQDVIVTRPLDIEFPRSLVDVVVSWNIPMHLWLKKYVFRPCQVSRGIIQAIFSTYLLSSYLHGMKFQIWSVLLTLGALTWLEFQLRRKLAAIYDSCIQSRPCSKVDGQCSRGHADSSGLFTGMANGSFALIAIMNLAYLGSVFDGQEESSASTVISTWHNLGFYSHFIVLSLLIIYTII
ncbi:Protein-serine O-palmitoleoyltransferase porcupine [Halotydeus destructor]|nr:Protein-serine O-palmitoleoyltransferase porcupine [Halotydeus destructor]